MVEPKPVGIVKIVMFAVSLMFRKTAPAEAEVRVMTRLELVLAGLPFASWICTVMTAELTPAVSVCGGVVMASFVGKPGVT